MVMFSNKKEMYETVTSQIASLTEKGNEKVPHGVNLTTNLANVSSVLFYALNGLADEKAQLQKLPVNWVGFYLMTNPQIMTLGPFQGKVACTEIKVGKGVCGTAVLTGKSQLVPDTHAFPGHIACDSESESEVVIPIRNKEHRIVGVLDIDSTLKGHFDEEDVENLEKICAILGDNLYFTSSVMAMSQPKGAPDLPPGAPVPGAKPLAAVTINKDGTVSPVGTPTVADMRLKTINGWDFKVTELKKMASQARIAELEELVGAQSLPEIMFDSNMIEFKNKETDVAFTINLEDALKNAANFYATEHYQNIKNDIAVPTAGFWKDKTAKVFDANIDWAFRNCYEGTWTKKTAIRPATREIDMNLLRDTSLEILFFDSLDLFEDDLHDFGMSHQSLKFRVMEPCFFILLRHFVRIDRSGAKAREVRVFHKFGEDCVIVETTEKSVGDCAGKISEADEHMLHLSEDELCAKMTVNNKSVVEIALTQE